MKRTNNIIIRVSIEEKKKIKEISEKYGMTLSNYIRYIILKETL